MAAVGVGAVAAVAGGGVAADAAGVGAGEDDVISGWSSQPFQLSFPFLDFSMATTVTPEVEELLLSQCNSLVTP